jgi:hypothetical protein
MLVGLIKIEDYLHTKSYHNLGKLMTKISQLLLYNCSDTDSYSCRSIKHLSAIGMKERDLKYSPLLSGAHTDSRRANSIHLWDLFFCSNLQAAPC